MVVHNVQLRQTEVSFVMCVSVWCVWIVTWGWEVEGERVGGWVGGGIGVVWKRKEKQSCPGNQELIGSCMCVFV